MKRSSIILLVVGVCLLVIGVVLIPVVNVIVHQKVTEAVVIKEGAALYDIWKNTTIPIYLQFYMFNLSNPDEVRNGSKPAMVERGPYTYKETREKEIISWNPNGTVTYRQIRRFIFMHDMSVGDESELYTSVNIPFMTLVSSLQWEPDLLRKLISFGMEFAKQDIFMTRTMKEIIWGYVDPTLTMAKKIAPQWFYTDFVGYFINKNNSDDGVYTIFTGENDISKLGIIDTYNGSRMLNFWTTNYANMINGSDGTIGPPFLESNSYNYLFSSDICRSAYGIYSEDVTTPQGIFLKRFISPMEQLGNITINPDNIGFCTPQTKCMNSGVLNISMCQMADYFHIPVVVSFPHFYLAADEYVNGVEGMHPNKEEHQTCVDIHPMTGLVLQASKRLQINMYTQSIPDIKETYNVRKVVLPIFWLNESAVVDDSHADMLKNMLLTPLLVVKVVEIGLIVLGSTVILGVVLYSLVINYQSNKKPVEQETTGNIQVRNSLTNNDEADPLVPEHNCTTYSSIIPDTNVA